MTREDGDRLCRDILGVLLRISSAQRVLSFEECLGCGQLADPDQPCATCRSVRLGVERRRAS